MTKRLRRLKKSTHFLFIATIFLFLALTTGCDHKYIEPVNPYSYFPLEVGQYRIYQVSEDVYSAGQKNPVKKTWQERDEVIRKVENSNGGVGYILARSTRETKSQFWTKTKEYMATSFPDKIIINLDNEITTPLIFPYSSGLEWDGYQYFNLNTLDPRFGHLHHYERINLPLRIDSLILDKTLKVSERSDTTNRAQFRLGFKYYASGIGLVLDEQTDFDYLQENGEFIGYRTIASGSRKVKRIVAYGVSK